MADINLLRRVAGLSLRDKVGVRTSGGARFRAAAPSCRLEPIKGVQGSDYDSPKVPTIVGFLGLSNWE